MNNWVDKYEVMRWCSIRPTTYKKRLKDVPLHHRRRGYRGKTEVNTKVVYSTFCSDKLPTDELKSVLSYSLFVNWNYIGNIVPVSSTPLDLKNKMGFLYDCWLVRDKSVEIVYSIESNPKDEYFHSHFLLKTTIPKHELEKDILLICDQNSIRESRLYLRQYDPNCGSGVEYTLKDPIGGFGFLSNKIVFVQ